MQRTTTHGNLRWHLSLILGCIALLLPPSANLFVAAAASIPQPMEEEESRSPVETTKISVGSVHREPDRRERPEPLEIPSRTTEPLGQLCTMHGLSGCIILHAFDLHNGLGGPLIV